MVRIAVPVFKRVFSARKHGYARSLHFEYSVRSDNFYKRFDFSRFARNFEYQLMSGGRLQMKLIYGLEKD